jgi:hypothetical protein
MLRRHEGDSNKAKTTTLKSRLWSWVEVEDSKLNSKDAWSGWRVITELATTPQKYREIYLSSRSSRLKPSSFLQLHGRLAWCFERPAAGLLTSMILRACLEEGRTPSLHCSKNLCSLSSDYSHFWDRTNESLDLDIRCRRREKC